MTILEAIQADGILADFTREQIEVISELRGINTRSQLTTGSVRDFEILKADLCSEILLTADFSEGSLSIKHDKKALKEYLRMIADRYDDEKLKTVAYGGAAGTGAIKDISQLW